LQVWQIIIGLIVKRVVFGILAENREYLPDDPFGTVRSKGEQRKWDTI
jgi:hypothetical protein